MTTKQPEIKQIPTPPFCVSCAHFISGDGGKNEVQAEHRCAKFPMLDIVTGIRFNMACNVVRSPDAPCSEEGKLFEALTPPIAVTSGVSVEPNKTTLN